MLKNLGIVEVDLTSFDASGRTSQLATQRFAGQRLVEWVVRRVTESQRLDGVVALLADTELTAAITSWVPADVPVFVSQRADGLGRILETIDEYPARAIVRVGIDNAFVDPVLIDRLVSMAEANPKSEYVSYCSGDGCPVAVSRMGIFAEWISARAIRRAAQATSHASERDDSVAREDSTHAIYARPDAFQVQLIPIPSELDQHDLRLTIDGPHDLECAEQILDALGPDRLDWRGIADLLHHQPHLRQRMAVRHRVSDALVD